MNKKLALVFILFVIIIVVVGFFSSSFNKTEIKPSPAPYSLDTVNQWREIVPGTSTQDDLVQKLGSPVASKNTPLGVVYEYPTTNQYWTNEVAVKDNKVTFVIERIFPPQETSLDVFMSRFSDQPTRLFGPGFNSGTHLFIYPSSGLAYLASESQRTVYQIWHFPSTTLEDFLKLPWAKGYGLQPPERPEDF